MSQSRNLGAREFALCLVILANAVWLGATILNTAAATPTALADVIEENTIASFSRGKEDDPTTSVELMLQGLHYLVMWLLMIGLWSSPSPSHHDAVHHHSWLASTQPKS